METTQDGAALAVQVDLAVVQETQMAEKPCAI